MLQRLVPVFGHKLPSELHSSKKYEVATFHTSIIWGFLSLFLCLFLFSNYDLFYLLTVGAEGYCCTCSHSVTHTHTHSSGQGISLSHRPLPDNTLHSQQTDIRSRGGIRTHTPSKWAAADPRPRRRGHWDRRFSYFLCTYCNTDNTTPSIAIWILIIIKLQTVSILFRGIWRDICKWLQLRNI